MYREPSVPYTPDEDKIIQKCVVEAMKENKKLYEGFYKAANEINTKLGKERGATGIEYRWYRCIRNKVLQPEERQKKYTGRKYTRQEDEIISNCIMDAVLKKKQTVRKGAKTAIDKVQKECGITRTLNSIQARWYSRIFPKLPQELQNEFKIIKEDINSIKTKHPITATDIVNIAETRSRNPIHVLGAAGNVKNPCNENELTAACALQLAEMKRQIEAQEKLIQTLSKQLASSNSYRSALISLKYCNPEGSNILAIINALMRAPSVLSTLEQRRLVTVLRAGWPELFKEEAVYHDAITN
jgi:hypothetical protein